MMTDRRYAFISGNLNIAAVKQDDINDAKIWKCYISNAVMGVDAGGSETTIIASEQPAGECQNQWRRPPAYVQSYHGSRPC